LRPIQPLIKVSKGALLSGQEERVMFSITEHLNDHIPLGIVALPIHPSARRKGHRRRERSQGLLPLKIEVEFEIREHELAGGTEYRLTVSKTGKI
jgi:hypothetical protein